MKDNRPVNLQLQTMKFPITAIISILHRLSGVLLFISIPFLLWGLKISLQSPVQFDQLKACLANPGWKLLVWVILSGLLYHLVAGVRHMLMDMGIGEGRDSGPRGAKIVLVIAVILILLAGVWIW